MYPWDEKFVWNYFLIKDFMNTQGISQKWILPVIYGYINILSKSKV